MPFPITQTKQKGTDVAIDIGRSLLAGVLTEFLLDVEKATSSDSGVIFVPLLRWMTLTLEVYYAAYLDILESWMELSAL